MLSIVYCHSSIGCWYSFMWYQIRPKRIDTESSHDRSWRSWDTYNPRGVVVQVRPWDIERVFELIQMGKPESDQLAVA